MAITAYDHTELSGSTSGKPIVVTAVELAGAQTVHTAQAAPHKDQVALTLHNISTEATATATLVWGDVESPWVLAAGESREFRRTITAGLVLKVFASETSVIQVEGHVNKISRS